MHPCKLLCQKTISVSLILASRAKNAAPEVARQECCSRSGVEQNLMPSISLILVRNLRKITQNKNDRWNNVAHRHSHDNKKRQSKILEQKQTNARTKQRELTTKENKRQVLLSLVLKLSKLASSTLVVKNGSRFNTFT